MTEPTDNDRAEAYELAHQIWWVGACRAPVGPAAENLATVLAEARAPGEKLRADLLALADEMDDELAAQGFLLDRCIRPGDRLRDLVKGQR